MILRSQQLMQVILTQMAALPRKQRMRKEYARMAYDFPIVMRNSGLALGAAWLAEQETTGAAQFRSDLQEAMGIAANRTLVTEVRDASNRDYIMLTRTAFQALEYYRRFSASVLGIHQDDLDHNEIPGDPSTDSPVTQEATHG